MDLWKCRKWQANPSNSFGKTGLRFRVEKDVDFEVRRACLDFAKWLRKEYMFPSRVTVYIKSSYYIRGQNGDNMYGTCWRPADKTQNSYIRISTGDYDELLSSRGRDNALTTILFCIAIMLTHYYQWLNDMDDLTEKEEVAQAERHAKRILSNYSKTRDHP